MAEITRLQIKILEDLYKRDIEHDISVKIQTSLYDLDEKDEIVERSLYALTADQKIDGLIDEFIENLKQENVN